MSNAAPPTRYSLTALDDDLTILDDALSMFGPLIDKERQQWRRSVSDPLAYAFVALRHAAARLVIQRAAVLRELDE